MGSLTRPYEKDRIPHIDGLRAIAALSVLASHVVSYNPLITQVWVRRIIPEGAHGIDLFFILSGFCLSYPTLAALEEGGSSVFDTAS